MSVLGTVGLSTWKLDLFEVIGHFNILEVTFSSTINKSELQK